MKTVKYFFLFLMIACWQQTFGQTKDLLYPGMTILSETKEPGKLSYVLERWGQKFSMELAKTNQTVSIKLLTEGGDLIGLGAMGKQGLIERRVVLRRGTKGFTAFWHFAMDRTKMGEGGFRLIPLMEEGAPLWTCQMCCYETYMMEYIAKDDEYAKAQLADGVPPKDWDRFFEITKDLGWETYNDCVDACLSGGECSNYSW
ncbi:MAG: hypothetical protein KDD63_13580 [Bacteroidetes bacterium]|nr:hypothetical protein [Bacteroidota bacterium]MCB0844696.1 hypothetical protein [Bacteroidota bacterium]MCB0853249.1 hypothetical protein [Bacteroidota bacterium]